MDTIGEVHDIVHRLKEPATLDPDGVRRWRILFTQPGAKAGVVSAGYLRALATCDIPATRFDMVVGVSAGSWNNVGYCAGQTEALQEVYEALCDVPFWFPQGIYGDWMNLDYLIRYLRERGIDALPRDAWPDCHIGLSDLVGKLHLPRAQDVESVLSLCAASSSIAPLTYGVEIGGTRYVDGGHAHPCPISRIVRHIYGRGERVDVLVLSNRPHPRHLSTTEQLLWQTLSMSLLPWYPWALSASTSQFDIKMARAAKMATRKRDWIRIGMVFPSVKHAVLPVEGRKYVVRDAGHRSEDECVDLIMASV